MKNVMTKKGALVYGMFWSIMMILFTLVLEPLEGKDIAKKNYGFEYLIGLLPE